METKKEPGRQMRFTENELAIIRNTFKGNPELLLLMRKVFLPELDPKAPLGQMIDLWMSLPVKEMTAQEAQVNILARNSLIMHVEQQLLQLNVLAEMPNMTVEELLEKHEKDSSK
jgi:hypothetical protein